MDHVGLFNFAGVRWYTHTFIGAPMLKNRTLITAFALSLTCLTSTAAMANDKTADRIRKAVAPLLQDQPIETITKSSHAGLYELLTPSGIVYTDQTGSFVIFNAALVDSKTKVNLTSKRLDDLSKFTFADLPFSDAIKTVQGDGSRQLVTFEDPNCGYCRKLQQEIKKLENVTVYTFLTPILAQDSEVKSKSIWCAPNPTKVWADFMVGDGKIPPAPEACATPLSRNQALYKKLHLNGTPALLFPSGSKTHGYVKAEQIEASLSQK